jgi:hypothetical protein
MLDHSTRVIPRREPELIAREARRLYGGCADKVATTSLDRIFVRGAGSRPAISRRTNSR